MPISPQSRPRPGRPKDPVKRRGILCAAKRLFPRHGYDGVSMDTIAAEAGVSKLTLYSHFKDKEALFTAAVHAVCEEQLPETAFALRPDSGPIREVLMTIAGRIHALVAREDTIWLYRMLAGQGESKGQGESTGKLAEIFYRAGPRRTLDEFEKLLRQADRTGVLSVPDPERSADHFLSMVKGVWHMRRLIGHVEPDVPEHVEAHLTSVVDLFLRAHRPPDRDRSAPPRSQ